MTVGGCIVRLDLGGGCENNMEMNDLDEFNKKQVRDYFEDGGGDENCG